MRSLYGAVRRIRPAPVASLVARLTGMARRRNMQTEDGTFWINPVSDLGYSLQHGGYEPSLKTVLERYLRPGFNFVDLGANEGYFSVIASRLVGPDGSVIAVEPQSRLIGVIQSNLRLNQCLNARVINVAISSNTGSATLELTSGINTGGTSLTRSTGYRYRTEAVKTLTLSDFLHQSGINRCDLMKVDIEGAEYDVFMNDGGVLKSGIIRHIEMEIHNSILARRGLSGNDLHEHMLASGYVLNSELGNWVYCFRGGGDHRS